MHMALVKADISYFSHGQLWWIYKLMNKQERRREEHGVLAASCSINNARGGRNEGQHFVWNPILYYFASPNVIKEQLK